MSISLYDASVSSYLQILGSIDGVLSKSREHLVAGNIPTDSMMDFRLYPDMFPFERQVKAMASMSIGALRAAQKGTFSPPGPSSPLDYEGLMALVKDTLAELRTITPEEVNKLVARSVEFKLGDQTMYFLAEDFLLSFALPNFYFHSAAAYNLLRMVGVPLGKQDFLGQIRFSMSPQLP
jgi:uncharacterized protein